MENSWDRTYVDWAAHLSQRSGCRDEWHSPL